MCHPDRRHLPEKTGSAFGCFDPLWLRSSSLNPALGRLPQIHAAEQNPGHARAAKAQGCQRMAERIAVSAAGLPRLWPKIALGRDLGRNVTHVPPIQRTKGRADRGEGARKHCQIRAPNRWNSVARAVLYNQCAWAAGSAGHLLRIWNGLTIRLSRAIVCLLQSPTQAVYVGAVGPNHTLFVQITTRIH